MSDDEVRRPSELSHSPFRAELAVFFGLLLGFFGSLPVCLVLLLTGGLNSAVGVLGGMFGPPTLGLFAGLRYAFLEMPHDSRAVMRRCIFSWACAGIALLAGSQVPGLFEHGFDLLAVPPGGSLPLGGLLLVATFSGLLLGVVIGVVRGFVAIRGRLARKKREFEYGLAVAADRDTARAALEAANTNKVGPPDEAIRGSDHQQVAEGPSIDEQR